MFKIFDAQILAQHLSSQTYRQLHFMVRSSLHMYVAAGASTEEGRQSGCMNRFIIIMPPIVIVCTQVSFTVLGAHTLMLPAQKFRKIFLFSFVFFPKTCWIFKVIERMGQCSLTM